LVVYVASDLTANNYRIVEGVFVFENPAINVSQEFRQSEGLPYGDSPILYLQFINNTGSTRYCYRKEKFWVSAYNYTGYRGEVYLANGNGKAEYEYWSPNVLGVDLNVTENDILVINQDFDYNWKSTDREVKTYAIGRLGYLISAEVKPVDKRVVFYYLPYSFVIGLIISLLSVSLCLIYYFKKSLIFKLLGKLKII
jgi:hypothetical protein